MRTRSFTALLLLLAGAACVAPDDNPTSVHDLRVLGVALDPPELLAPTCALTPQALAAFAVPVKYTALLQDPQGEGRKLRYELFACAFPGNRDCSEPNDRVRLVPPGASDPLAEADPGELTLSINPGTAFLAERQQFLLQQVFEQDLYKGLGGLRMPLVLHVQAGEEEIYASKLMVFSCQLFPDMKANVQPVLPGLTLDGAPWGDEPRSLSGEGPFELLPVDFADRQEPYVVPSLSLEPVHLVESWKIAWYTDYGRMSAAETGGADIGGEEGRHRVEWVPPKVESRVERDFQIWAVVRDGRGGLTWLNRRGHYTP